MQLASHILQAGLQCSVDGSPECRTATRIGHHQWKGASCPKGVRRVKESSICQHFLVNQRCEKSSVCTGVLMLWNLAAISNMSMTYTDTASTMKASASCCNNLRYYVGFVCCVRDIVKGPNLRTVD